MGLGAAANCGKPPRNLYLPRNRKEHAWKREVEVSRNRRAEKNPISKWGYTVQPYGYMHMHNNNQHDMYMYLV